MRNAPALGFKQQYAGDDMEGEADAQTLDAVHGDEQEIVDAIEKEAENLTPESEADAFEDTLDVIIARKHDLEQQQHELDQSETTVIEELVVKTKECEEHGENHPEGTTRRMQILKQIRLKHLHRRLAAVRASKMLGAGIKPYARPARHLSARVSASPGSASRLARRMQRTRF